MDQEPTRFFCQCGRLLTVASTIVEAACPSCKRKTSLHARDAATSGTQLLSPQTGAVVGGYRIEAPLGSGGMGSVYRAVNPQTGATVALKLLHPSLQAREDFVNRFRREARSVAGLEHPNVVRVVGYGLDTAGPWLAMELLEGQDLLQAHSSGSVDEPSLIEHMKQAALGLRAAATQGIIHRDVKPANLLLLSNGTLKVADFGLAKDTGTDSRLTLTGEVLGTPHYMSPEQGKGDPVDFRSDLYALGATFYHLRCGSPPFMADTPVAVIMKHLSEDPIPLRQRTAATSAGFEAIIHRLLQKKAKDRYSKYDTLLEDLRRLEAGKKPSYGATPPERVVRDGGTTFVLPREAQTELVLKPAGSLQRSLAMLFDLALLEILFLFLGKLWRYFMADAQIAPAAWRAWSGDPVALDMGLAALYLALPILYFVASDARGGKSFGKTRFRLRVCRNDGLNAGLGAAQRRLLLFLPALLFLSPTLSASLLSMPGFDWRASSLGQGDVHSKLRLLGGVYVLALSALGRLSGAGVPLHDALSGTRVWLARKSQPVGKRLPSLYRPPKATTAFLLSIFPGGGLFYTGQLTLGLLSLVALPAILVTRPIENSLWAWLLSATLASLAARRRARSILNEEAADQTAVLFRQES